ncbi:DUF7225 domain-containing protein [Bacillus subtilis]|uniref:DUF7225 domain-containing protein n=1 Tax=Bacillus subtilis TaxID=1423 RepID=UPI000DF05056|nr:hypothetical protein [Bacillus subtilis]AXC53027.1 hypothetical protein DQ231_09230 [Bacillus spizizenii]MCR1990836.1 hypothetical protein [Bacillus subtilis]
MTIYEQIKDALKNKINELVSPQEVKKTLQEKYGTNPDSIILSDYCYNRYNKGISFYKHLFEYMNRSSYKYLGENSLYTGLIFRKSKGEDKEVIVGEWVNGVKSLREASVTNNQINDQAEIISKEQLVNLYNEYNQILRYEMNVLNCKPTELRHLIGRIGEFICAIQTNGTLARQTNQHGFDVVSDGRRISVKTTAQSSGFISINKNTFDDFDDFFVVQYVNDDFKVIFFGSKEEVQKISRIYGSQYEVEISLLKKLNKEYQLN